MTPMQPAKTRALGLMLVLGPLGCAPDYLDLGYDNQPIATGTTTTTSMESTLFCAPGETRECYTGPEGTKGQGICKPGTETCNTAGTAFGECDGEIHPSVEDCATAVDEDCDGLAPPCQGMCSWSRSFGDAQAQAARSLAIDQKGNLSLVGTFLGAIDFGGGPMMSGPGTDTDSDSFVAKLTPEGGYVWARGFPGDNAQLARSIAFDAEGSVIVAGKFTGSIDFGNGPAVSQAVEDIFVVKLRGDDGGHTWSRHFGSASVGSPNVATTSTGDVILFGAFSGVLDFGCGPLAGNGGLDLFAVKFAGQDGACLWSSSFGDSGYANLNSVAIDNDDNLILGGTLSGTVDFGGGQLTSNGADVFVAKLKSDGDHVWSRVIGSGGFQGGHQVATDNNGDVLVTGEYGGTLDFGLEPLTAIGGGDLFVAKLAAADGSPMWSKSYGDAGPSGLLSPTRSAAADSAGNVLVGGQFSGTLDFGGGPLASLQEDVYVAKLTSGGEHVWSKRFGDSDNGTAYQAATGIRVDEGGGALLTGQFQGAVSFGCGPLVSAGSSDAFVVRLSP